MVTKRRPAKKREAATVARLTLIERFLNLTMPNWKDWLKIRKPR